MKSARIMDWCGKSSGFTDFENIVDRGSTLIFDADSGLCVSHVRTLSPKRNLDHRSFFSHAWYVDEFIQILFFREVHFNSGVRLLLELSLCCCHQPCCLLYYLGEINSGINRTSLPLNLYTSVF